MSYRKKLFGILVLLIVITGFIIWLLIFSIDNNILNPYSEGTEVGYVYIGGKNTSQAESYLQSAIQKWKNADNLKIELSYQDYSYQIEVDPDIFQFNVNRTLEKVVSGQKMNYELGINVIDVSIKPDKAGEIENIIRDKATDLKFTSFKYDLIEKEVLKYVSFLFPEIYIDIGFAVDDTVSRTNLIHEVTIKYQHAEHMNYQIEDLLTQPIEIKGKQQFSLNNYLIKSFQNNKITPIPVDEVERIYDHYLSSTELKVLATGIFQSVLKTNFMNFHKEISPLLPTEFMSFTDVGLEAVSQIDYDLVVGEQDGDTVIQDVNFESVSDLTFYNPNEQSFYITIEYKLIDLTPALVFKLYGTPFVHSYDINKSFEFINREHSTPGYYAVVDRVVTYLGSNTPVIFDRFEDTYMPRDME